MKKIFTLNNNLFFIENHYYAVDKEVDIKDGDYPQFVIEHLLTGEYITWQIDNFNDIDNNNQYKIIFTTNSLLKLPILVFPEKENKISELARINCQEFKKGFDGLLSETTLSLMEFQFSEGYKANPARFTEQDLIKFEVFKRKLGVRRYDINEKSYWMTDKEASSNYGGKTDEEIISLYIKSNSIKSFEVEMEKISVSTEIAVHAPNDWLRYVPKTNPLGQVEAINITK
jgi:hypothetical protein